jgi:hypothetical protein
MVLGETRATIGARWPEILVYPNVVGFMKSLWPLVLPTQGPKSAFRLDETFFFIVLEAGRDVPQDACEFKLYGERVSAAVLTNTNTHRADS